MSEYEIRQFGELEPGDMIIGPDGLPVEVTAAYEEHIPETMYLVELEDGSEIEVSGNHLWYIETAIDRGLHRQRLRQGRRLFRALTPEVRADLLDTALLSKPEETTLAIFLRNLRLDGQEVRDAVVRIAESAGHIAEETVQAEELYDGTLVGEPEMVRIYDMRILAQQVLALAGGEERKAWPVIMGRVVTTEDMLGIQSEIGIPEVQPVRETKKKGRG